MPAPQTATEILAAAELAFADLNANGWGEVYIVFLDQARATQAVAYISPLEDTLEEHDMCAEEVKAALDAGWRPVCLQVLPYAAPTVVPLQDELTIDDKAVIWELNEGKQAI